MLASASALAQLGASVPNWSVGGGGSGSTSGSGGIGAMHTQTDVTQGITFVAVAPCRIIDTRGPAGTFGGPILTAGAGRSFALPSGPCAGIPTGGVFGVGAYSLNITVTGTAGAGFLKVFPTGGTEPTVSSINYTAGQTLANAVIVAAGTGEAITLKAGVANTHVIVDINGYFTGSYNTGGRLILDTTADGHGVIEVQNLSISNGFGVNAVTANGIGVYGQTGGFTGGNAGVEGAAPIDHGTAVGVLGVSGSPDPDSAGIKGFNGTGQPGGGVTGRSPAGVRGEGKLGAGVLGLSEERGVVGALVNSSGSSLAIGLLGTFGTAGDATTGAWAVFGSGNLGATGTKHFVEPHPSDPNKVIVYTSLEGREAGTYFRGTARTIEGQAIIDVPEDFRIVTDEEGMTVQLTPLRGFASMYVESEDLNQVVVRSSKDVTFHYLVQGVRRAFRELEPVQRGSEFVPSSAEDRMPEWLTEEAKRRLIANGTYNLDGTVNLGTAERAGWTTVWTERERQAREATQSAAAERAKQMPQLSPSRTAQVEP
jgi:hypothetical protein